MKAEDPRMFDSGDFPELRAEGTEIAAEGEESEAVKPKKKTIVIFGITVAVSTFISWAISAGSHALLILVLAAITWFGGGGMGVEETVEVGFSAGGESGEIGMGPAELEEEGAGIVSPDSLTISSSVEMSQAALVGGAFSLATSSVSQMPLLAGGGAEVTAGDWGGYAAGGGGEGGGTASFFGLKSRGKDFIYVVDCSSSMKGEPFQAAQRELLRSVMALDRGMRFYIIFYNQQYFPMEGGSLVRATGENRSRYLEWVKGIRPFDGTNPTEAMKLALSMKPDAVWLLSDGLFSDSACDAIREANPGRKVQVNTIAFYNESGKAVLQRIAEENRGQYRFVSKP